MPTIVSGLMSPSIPPNSIRMPMGSSSGQRVRASVSLMTATWGASAPSRSSKRRPRSSGIPIALKDPELLLEQRDQASAEQSGPHQEDDRDNELRDDEPVTQPAGVTAARVAPLRIFEGRDDVGLSFTPARQKRQRDRRQTGDANRKE